jgi:sec-independent protein translocase protein TatB
MHLGDGIIIFVIALILFGPKKLPEMARQVAKLMAEFRRASNEFKTQIDEELRSAEQADRQKQISAAASPAVTAPPTVIEPTILPPRVGEPVSKYAYLDPAEEQRPDRSLDSGSSVSEMSPQAAAEATSEGASGIGTLADPSASLSVNGNSHESNGGGLAALFAARDRSTDIAYHSETAAAAPSGLPDEPAAVPGPLPRENFPANSADLIEGSAAEQAQASVHHV